MWIINIAIVFIGIFLFLWLNNQLKKNKRKLIEIQKKNDNLTEELLNLNINYEKNLMMGQQLKEWYDESLNVANTKINQLEEKLVQFSANDAIQSAKENYSVELENQIAKLEELLKSKHSELELLSTNAATIAIDESEKLRRLEELETLIKASERRIESGRKVLEEIEVQRKEIKNSLDQLSVLHRSVLAMEDGPGVSWTFAPGNKIRLVELIHQLVDEYGSQFPILKKELLKAEWSSVWLPQVQQLCSREGLDRSGIYKLTLRSDPKIVYIGQAQSIKDRWYTHIKKMIGVEAKGMERLYEYRPDDFEWSVVEFKEGNLDSDEKYWIDYYGCREIGLNKKG